MGYSDEEQRILDHIHLIPFTGRHYLKRYSLDEDLYAHGVIGLLRAAREFDPDRGAKFPTYAVHKIRAEMSNCLLKRRRQKRKPTGVVVSMDAPLEKREGNKPICGHDILGTDPDLVFMEAERNLQQEEVRKAVSRLPDRERTVVETYFGLNGSPHTQREVAEKIRASETTAHKLLHRGLHQLREILKEKSPSPVVGGQGA